MILRNAQLSPAGTPLLLRDPRLMLLQRDTAGDNMNGILAPQTSRAALAFVRSLGAKEHGIVPGLCWLHDARLNVPGVLTTFNREAVPQRAASL